MVRRGREREREKEKNKGNYLHSVQDPKIVCYPLGDDVHVDAHKADVALAQVHARARNVHLLVLEHTDLTNPYHILGGPDPDKAGAQVLNSTCNVRLLVLEHTGLTDTYHILWGPDPDKADAQVLNSACNVRLLVLARSSFIFEGIWVHIIFIWIRIKTMLIMFIPVPVTFIYLF